jgi:hypothetical protein
MMKRLPQALPSQMEALKTQNYIAADTNSEATYAAISSGLPNGYFIGSINRAGSTVATIKGIPWDTQAGTAVGTDAGIQKIILVVKQGSSWSDGKVVITLENYKVATQ